MTYPRRVKRHLRHDRPPHKLVSRWWLRYVRQPATWPYWTGAAPLQRVAVPDWTAVFDRCERGDGDPEATATLWMRRRPDAHEAGSPRRRGRAAVR